MIFYLLPVSPWQECDARGTGCIAKLALTNIDPDPIQNRVVW